MNRIRLAAEKHLGETARDSLERSYASAIDAIHGGDGDSSVDGLVREIAAAAGEVGGDELKQAVSSEIASIIGRDA